MIRSFKHKGLEKYFTKGTASGIQSAHSKSLRLILGRLSASTSAQDMDLPGLYLHQLRGKQRGRWSVRVGGNWRITFKFEGPDAVEKWKDIVSISGPVGLRSIKGLHDESLRGEWKGFRSSRLGKQHRVISQVVKEQILKSAGVGDK